MASLTRFSPYEVDDATLHHIATGREALVGRILGIIARNAEGGPIQHLQIVAPRGYGKSFLIRLVQSALHRRAAEGAPLRMAMLPEEQRNVNAPHRLLEEIGRILAGRPAESVMARKREAEGAWEASVAALDADIAAALPPEGGVVVASVENFDVLLRRHFKKPQDQSRLRAWLARPGARLMLLASSTRQADAKYEQRLFHATGVISLDPWQETACLDFFGRLRALKHSDGMPPEMLAKARAVAQFIGGSPRMATVLSGVLESQDSLQAAGVLDALVDELAPYYKHRLDDLSGEAESVLDTLLRGGEPASSSELARRMEVPQSDIARAIQDLRGRGELVGEKAAGSAEVLYRVGDRLMAHYYRKRHLSLHGGGSPLEAIAEFLARFFTPEEKRVEAERLRGMGRAADAAVLDRLYRQDMPRRDRPDWLRDSIAQTIALVEKGEAAQAVALARRAVARAQGDALALASATRLLGWSLGQMGAHGEAVPVLRQAMTLAEQAGDPREEAAATRLLGWSLGRMGAPGEAVPVLRQAITLAEQAGDLGEQSEATRLLGWSLGEMGVPGEAVPVLRRAITLAEQAGDLREQAEATSLLGLSLGQMGAPGEAVPVLRQAITLAEQAGDLGEEAWALAHLTQAARMGRQDGLAVERWGRLVRIALAASSMPNVPDPLLWLDDAAVAALRSGGFAEVWRAARRLPGDGFPGYVPGFVAEALAVAAQAGRADGYAMLADFLEGLLESGDPGSRGLSLLRAVLAALIPRIPDPALLRDLVALLAERLPEGLVTERAMLEAAALRREQPDNPSALQRVDPDIATAVDRMLGFQPAPAQALRRRAPRGTAKKK